MSSTDHFLYLLLSPLPSPLILSPGMAQFGAVYHYTGDVSNMKIVIRLEKSTTIGMGRKETREMSEMEMEERSETVVNWEEKIECPWKKGEGSGTTNRIFTYTKGDKLPSFITNQEQMLTTIDIDHRRNSTNANLNQHRNKKVSPFDVWSRSNPIVDRPVPIDRRNLVNCNRSTMYIMAYLGSMERSDGYNEEEDEYAVCRISLFQSGKLLVEPRIGDRDALVKLNSIHGQYRAHVRIEEETIVSKETGEGRRRSSLEERIFDEEFTNALNDARIPDENTLEMSYRVIIDKAIDFDYDGIFIEYAIDLPNNLTLLKDDEKRGRTMQCFSREDENHSRVFHIDHSLELTVVIRPSSLTLPLHSPRIRMRIVSRDAWGRHYCAGYGVLSLPITPIDSECLSIHSWRVSNPSDSRSSMREFFIGNARDLNDFFSVDYSDPLSRVGLITQSSGSIQCLVSSSWQSGRFVVDERSLDKVRFGDKMQKIGIDFSLHWRIMKALMEFDEARRELLRIRSISNRHLNTVNKK